MIAAGSDCSVCLDDVGVADYIATSTEEIPALSHSLAA